MSRQWPCRCIFQDRPSILSVYIMSNSAPAGSGSPQPWSKFQPCFGKHPDAFHAFCGEEEANLERIVLQSLKRNCHMIPRKYLSSFILSVSALSAFHAADAAPLPSVHQPGHFSKIMVVIFENMSYAEIRNEH